MLFQKKVEKRHLRNGNKEIKENIIKMMIKQVLVMAVVKNEKVELRESSLYNSNTGERHYSPELSLARSPTGAPEGIES